MLIVYVYYWDFQVTWHRIPKFDTTAQALFLSSRTSPLALETDHSTSTVHKPVKWGLHVCLGTYAKNSKCMLNILLIWEKYTPVGFCPFSRNYRGRLIFTPTQNHQIVEKTRFFDVISTTTVIWYPMVSCSVWGQFRYGIGLWTTKETIGYHICRNIAKKDGYLMNLD